MDGVETLNIPKLIFQTHKSVEYVNSKPKVRFAMNSWRKYTNEGFQYNFLNDNDCEHFMRNTMVSEFGEGILMAYNKLPIGVMKADLWRYCIIYYYGGIYADSDTICQGDINRFVLPKTKLVFGPENNVHYCQWTFSAPRKSPVLKHIINLSIKRILVIPKIKGEHIIHHLTGPGCWTDAIKDYCKIKNIPKSNSQHFIYNNKEIVCFSNNIFHSIIYHFFTGQDADGWKKERDKLFR